MNTNTDTQTQPEAVLSSAELGNDPEQTLWSAMGCIADDKACQNMLRAHIAAAVAAERERCAAWVDARRDAFCEEHGSIDPDTGTLEFGRGAHAEAKSEYVGELEEIAAGLRALRA